MARLNDTIVNGDLATTGNISSTGLISSAVVHANKFESDKGRFDHQVWYNTMRDTVSVWGDNGGAIVVIPEGTTITKNNMISDNTKVKVIAIPNGVTEINSHFGSYCTELTSIVVPDSVQVLGDWAFANCPKLENIQIGDNITSISSSTFYDNASLPTKGCLRYVGEYLLGYASGMELDNTLSIPDGTIGIADSAFSGRTSLTSVTLPSSIKFIGAKAFYNTGITSIVFPYGIREIQASTCDWCKYLQSVTIPDSVTTIKGSAFYYCSSLTSVVIGRGVKMIGAQAFQNVSCAITIKASIPPTLAEDQKVFNSAKKLYVPKSSVELYKATWTTFADKIEADPVS